MPEATWAQRLGIMDPDQARSIAHYSHGYQHDRFDELVVEHLARVAAAVPPDAQATAWLHDVLEQADADPGELCAAGLTRVELAALELLTRVPAERYEIYVLRIAHAPGEVGRLARCVKLADLDDHLAHDRMPQSAPPYAWARRHIVSAQLQRHEFPYEVQPGAA
jgi:hypothetical protein